MDTSDLSLKFPSFPNCYSARVCRGTTSAGFFSRVPCAVWGASRGVGAGGAGRGTGTTLDLGDFTVTVDGFLVASTGRGTGTEVAFGMARVGDDVVEVGAARGEEGVGGEGKPLVASTFLVTKSAIFCL